MAHKDDWYRKPALTVEAKEAFEILLSKRRGNHSRHEHMRIQAGALASAKAHYDALALIDRIVAEDPDHYGLTWLEEQRANSLRSLGKDIEAAEAYRRAIQRARNYPGVQGTAALDFAYWVAEARFSNFYQEATDILIEFWDHSPLFPSMAFKQHAALALLSHGTGDVEGAQANARAALGWAGRTQSNAANHRSLGLVGENSAAMQRMMSAIAEGKDPWKRGFMATIQGWLR